MNTDIFYKIYNSTAFSIILIILFVFSLSSLHLRDTYISDRIKNIAVTADNTANEDGLILNAQDQIPPIFDGVTPETPPDPEAIKTFTNDKIIKSLEAISFTENSIDELLTNIEKIYTQEITEELKSIEL